MTTIMTTLNFNPDIELYPCVADRRTHSKQSLVRVINWMQSNLTLKQKTLNYRNWLLANPQATKKEKSEQKVSHFCGVQFSGTFTASGTANDINKMSGLIVVDFDHISNLEAVREHLKADPYTFLLFTSPSNDGLKLVVKHDLKESKNWEHLFRELEGYYLNKYNLEADTSGKDISRMCFLPGVTDLYINDSCKLWQFSGVPEVQPKKKKEYSEHQQSDNDILNECYHLARYLFENKIDITDKYEDWITYGYCLCQLGEDGREVFQMVSAVNIDYDPEETDKNYDYMLKHYDSQKSGVCLFMTECRKAITEYQLFKTYGYRVND
jgi:hypothetical protein